MERTPGRSAAQKKPMNPLYINVHTNIANLSEDFSSVTKLVRQKYFQHLQKTILEHKSVLFKENEGIVLTDTDYKNFAQQIELKALNACMVLDLYRKEMLKQIKSIKDRVNEYKPLFGGKSLLGGRSMFILSSDDSDDDDSDSSIDMEMDSLNYTMNVDLFSDIPKQTEPAQYQDDVHDQMKEMFGSEDTINLEHLIFGDSLTPTMMENKRKRYLVDDDNTLFSNNLPHKKNNDSIYNNANSKKNIWRLEEYVQSAILQQRLMAIADLNPRKYYKVMRRIDAIFGNGSVDTDSLSPIDIAVLKFACKDRISHYVVTYLTTFYKEERIKSRFLFKQLSRALVQRISEHDPYIDSALIWKAMKDVFQKEQITVARTRDLRLATNKIFNIIRSLS